MCARICHVRPVLKRGAHGELGSLRTYRAPLTLPVGCNTELLSGVLECLVLSKSLVVPQQTSAPRHRLHLRNIHRTAR
jgi:hypothetical protein